MTTIPCQSRKPLTLGRISAKLLSYRANRDHVVWGQKAKYRQELCIKRNMDLVREILLRIEATEPRDVPKLDILGFEEEEIGLHVELVIEHGLVKGITIPRGDAPTRLRPTGSRD